MSMTSEIYTAADNLSRLIREKIEKNTTVIEYAVMENTKDLKMLVQIEEYTKQLEEHTESEG